MEVCDNPVVGLAEFMGPSRVREKQGELPLPYRRVQNRQPCLAGRIEALRRDAAQLASAGFGPVLLVRSEDY